MLIRSAGVVLFRSVKKREYLLLHYAAGHWDFPKGIIEKGETSKATALRELEEETSIVRAEILPKFKQTIRYTYTEKGKKILKFVVFYLAQTRQKKVEISWEHKGFIWLPYDKAFEKLTYSNAKNVLKKAEAWLNVKK